MTSAVTKRQSAFSDTGIKESINSMVEEVQALYLADEVPWAIGYSGGKDSSAVVQLAWMALSGLKAEQLHKPVYVMTTDTMVENPVISSWVERSLNMMGEEAKKQELPILPNLLKPSVENTFWVNLVGRGYPAPRHKFRWCTDRLKIQPSNKFIEDTVSKHGEVILLLGVRSAESFARAKSIARRKSNPRESLTKHDQLMNCLVYSPIETWLDDDVWAFLLRYPSPWNFNNKDLMNMYRGATEDNECPIVVDTSTPSCGNSRFGCWVCTLVEEDKSMGAMIQNDEEKEWMIPMLRLRDELSFRRDEDRARDRRRRDFRRMGGQVTLSLYADENGDHPLIPGPYTQKARADWLRRLLVTQQQIQSNESTPEYGKNIELLTKEELQEIRRIWVVDKHEIEDLVPGIYEEVMGVKYPGDDIEERPIFDSEVLGILNDCCEGNPLAYELARNLLDVEGTYRAKGTRRGLFDDLEKEIKRCFYEDKDDATSWAHRKAELKDSTSIDFENGYAEVNSPSYETEIKE